MLSVLFSMLKRSSDDSFRTFIWKGKLPAPCIYIIPLIQSHISLWKRARRKLTDYMFSISSTALFVFELFWKSTYSVCVLFTGDFLRRLPICHVREWRNISKHWIFKKRYLCAFLVSLPSVHLPWRSLPECWSVYVPPGNLSLSIPLSLVL